MDKNCIRFKTSNWSTPGPPEGWVWDPPKVAKGEPALFSDVDNPGSWSEFTFQPVFDTKGQKRYKYPALPTGIMPVPKNEDGKRLLHGWQFFYDGWTKNESDNTPARDA